MVESAFVSSTLATKAKQAVALASARQLVLVTAESCTAGRLSALLSDVPDAGQCLFGGFVVYSEAAKTALGVPADVLTKNGAVSEEVARLLSHYALIRAGADVSIAITGVAGPERDVDGHPVGLVFFGASRRGQPTRVTKKEYGKMERGAILENILDDALHLLLKTLE
jgi:nicotinamide-nucleotide amidase